jgi:GNAT superfamily N-acetyltransferase
MVQLSIDDATDTVLDNPVWHSLQGPLSRFAAPTATSTSSTELVHFDPEVSVFSAVDRIDPDVWQRVGELVGLEGTCGFFRDVVPMAPAGWEEHFRGSCLQMIAGELPDPSGLGRNDHSGFVDLGAEDAPEMLALADLTEPGPFSPRTHELGRYVGLRREGRLLAMAGERFRMPGFVEISAVCTHPDARGEGLAAELTLTVAKSIRAGGDEAMLHVLESNENAIRLYQKLGFVVRRSVDVVFAQWHGPDWRPSATRDDPEIERDDPRSLQGEKNVRTHSV